MSHGLLRGMLAAAVVALIGLGAYALWPQSRASEPSGRSASGAMRAPMAASPSDEQHRRLLSDPRVKAYQSQVAFQKQARRFFADAGKLAPAQREQQAQRLREQVGPREASGEMSAAEAMLLEVGLIQATVADESEQARQVSQVAARYRARSDQRQREWASRPKPQFDSYKRREADIVREVAAMQQIPGGLSRDEYLRQRLQQAREQIYLVHE
ncbi:hypothetical protein [Lysobacter sp. CA199]|uniref:hypothetical protein n=1 Tax=Lysobacter sp. CA199 TaxID=3455608 RepID=UPI003F8D7102